jgi:hypothetical protein
MKAGVNIATPTVPAIVTSKGPYCTNNFIIAPYDFLSDRDSIPPK